MPSPLFGPTQAAATYTALGNSDTPIMGMTEQQLLQQILVAVANLSTGGGGGGGTVTSFSFTDANGISGLVTDPTTTPNLTLALGNITPTRVTISTAGAVSTSEIGVTGTWFSGGSATTTKPKVLIEPTGTTSTGWSTNGTALGVNAASGFTGNLFDAQLNGTLKFRVDYNGSLRMAYFGTNIDIYDPDNTTRRWWCAGGRTFARDFNTTDDFASLGGDAAAPGLRLGSGVPVAWSDSAAWYGTSDLFLTRGAANKLGVSTAANADAAVVSTHTAPMFFNGVEYKVLLATP